MAKEIYRTKGRFTTETEVTSALTRLRVARNIGSPWGAPKAEGLRTGGTPE